MDIEINDMFCEKNQQLFTNKLRLDLERNCDALTLSSNNIVKIEIAKLFSSLKRIYSNYSCEIDNDKIKEILSQTKDELLDDIKIVINEKSKNNDIFISDNTTETINKKYLRKYYSHIDDTEQKFENNLSLCIKEHTNMTLFNQLINAYPCKNEDMHSELFCQANVDFASTLIKRITDESKHRNETLKNMSQETYSYYVDLTSSTKGNGQKKKVINKKD